MRKKKMKIKRVIEQILTFGIAGKMGHGSGIGYVRVAAGDPSKVVMDIDPAVQLSEVFSIGEQQYRLCDYIVFEVAGKSMEPQGIANGDFLLTKEIEGNEPVRMGEYIIIEVDPAKFDDPECDYKLRKSLITIRHNENIDTVMQVLRNQGHHQLLLEKYQKQFKDKYRKARDQYESSPLVASITYRDGEMRYSFHAREFVKYRAEIKARIETADTDWSSL